MLELTCIDDLDRFSVLRPEVDQFMAAHFPLDFARSHPWLVAWWAGYERSKRVMVYLARQKPTDELVAMVPLMVTRTTWGGFPVRKLELLGRGLGSENLPVRGPVGEVLDLILADLARNATWHVAQFTRVSDAELEGALAERCGMKKLAIESRETVNHLIQLSGGFEQYLKGRSKSFRQNLRTARNRMEREGEISFHHELVQSIQDRGYSMAKEVASQSWQYSEGTSHFTENGGPCFFENLLRAGCGGLDFWLILLNGKPIASLFGVRRDRRYFVVDVAFAGAHAKLSPGRLLYSHVIERVTADHGVDLVDLCGEGGYKKEYATETPPESTLTIYSRALYSLALRSIRRSGVYAWLGERLRGPVKHQDAP